MGSTDAPSERLSGTVLALLLLAAALTPCLPVKQASSHERSVFVAPWDRWEERVLATSMEQPDPSAGSADSAPSSQAISLRGAAPPPPRPLTRHLWNDWKATIGSSSSKPPTALPYPAQGERAEPVPLTRDGPPLAGPSAACPPSPAESALSARVRALAPVAGAPNADAPQCAGVTGWGRVMERYMAHWDVVNIVAGGREVAQEAAAVQRLALCAAPLVLNTYATPFHAPANCSKTERWYR